MRQTSIDKIVNKLRSKMNILVTGAAGSLGKAFVRLLQEDHELIGIDNSEWSVAEFEKEFPKVPILLEDFSEWRFDQHPVDLVIHAGAYKHLPLGEDNPNSFIDNNIIKTRKLFAEAYKNNADILFISSDKAVEPCNLYGYTKAIGEKLAKYYDGYIARCGNFLNSSGSVIPVWEKALKENKPLPVTDLGMKRFVIDLDDAAQQIWNGYIRKEKLIIPKCREISLKEILDEVNYFNNPIEIIGIRPGEKMQEKLRWEWE